MRNGSPGRREFLTAAGAGVVVSAGLAGTASAAPASSSSGITGGWDITRKDKGQPGQVRAILTFAEGGAFTGADLNPMSPPYLGSWAANGSHDAKAVFWLPFTDEKGRQIGTVRVKVSAHVNGDSISGSYTDTVFSQGQRQQGSGTFHGRRIDVD